MHQEQPADAFTLLTTDPPALSDARATDFLRRHYGLEGSLEAQYSERDQNFLVSIDTRPSYVLKIANSIEMPAITDMQVAALLHLEKFQPEIPVPRVIHTLDDQARVRIAAEDGRTHTARVLSWLPGTLVEFDALGADTAARMGSALATLGKALHEFEHPASDYPLLWDIKQAGKLREILDAVDDPALRDSLRGHLEHFVTAIEPRLRHLRAQIIHNDLNPGNIVFDGDRNRITGIIDFGDMIHSPLVVDVAVASAYLCKNDDAPFANVFEFVRGYHAMTPLREEELDLLPCLITTRTLATVMISHWRASRYPDNRDYILSSSEHALQILMRLFQHDPAMMTRDLQDYCDNEK